MLGLWMNEKERRGEEMNLKGRDNQNGAKPSEVQCLHTRKHEKGRWGV